jgi:hypothetical protein
MLPEFSARAVSLQVIDRLERRRADLVADEALVRGEVDDALADVARDYEAAELPRSYLEALVSEVRQTLPTRWLDEARRFTALERRGFGLWRSGDLVARIVYLFVGLAVGGLCVEAPFIPIWEKWFPFALAIGAWWLPDGQVAWHRRRYARGLGALVRDLDRAQPALEAHVSMKELLPPEEA